MNDLFKILFFQIVPQANPEPEYRRLADFFIDRTGMPHELQLFIVIVHVGWIVFDGFPDIGNNFIYFLFRIIVGFFHGEGVY